MPSEKDIAGVVREFKRAKGERGHDYLEEALAEAKRSLPHYQYAAIHQAARSRAGGRAAARTRMTSIEKALVLGPEALTTAELGDAVVSAEVLHAADMRRGLDSGARWLSDRLHIEKSRREWVTKESPGAGDVHIPTTAQDKKKKRPDLFESKKSDRFDDPGVMIALRLPTNSAEAMAVANGEPAARLHVTLAYLGRLSMVGTDGLVRAREAVARAAYESPILRGLISGIGRFAGSESSDNKDVIYASVDVPGLLEFRRRVVNELECSGVMIKNNHEFTPHITLSYVEPGAPTPRMTDAVRLRDVYFDKVVLSINDSDTAYELGGLQALADARMAALAAAAREEGQSPIASAPIEVVYPEQGLETVYMSADGHVMNGSVDPRFEAGDVVEVSSDARGDCVFNASAALVPASLAVVEKALHASFDYARHETPVPFVGPDSARLVFVAGAPTELEFARGEPLVGPIGATFNADYLKPLGLTRGDVALGFVVPTLPRSSDYAEAAPWADYVAKSLARWPQATVVALGRAAHDILGDRALLWLPHPAATHKNEARYDEQVSRKLRRIRKALDDGFVFAQDKQHQGARSEGTAPEILAGRIGETLVAGPIGAIARIAKAADEEQIVVGVVLDPYEIDTQGEWVPPAVIKDTAHGFLESRVIGHEHRKQASAGTRLVESWVERYPSLEDEKKAHNLQPHTAYETKYGDDKVHSGAWMVAVKLGDADWAAYKRGEITGFSVGGFSYKTNVTKAAMPAVKFVAGAPTKW